MGWIEAEVPIKENWHDTAPALCFDELEYRRANPLPYAYGIENLKPPIFDLGGVR